MARRLSDQMVGVLAAAAGPATDATRAEVARGVAELSRLFTRKRHDLTASYWGDPALRRAYLAYFLPVNLAKVQTLLDELPADWAAPRDDRRPLSMLDLGCGQGTGPLALLDWVNRRASSRPLGAVVAVDRAEPALGDCRRLWNAYQARAPVAGADLVAIHGDLTDSAVLTHPAVRQHAPYDLILLANSLNELFADVRDPVRRRAALVAALLGLLQPDGTLMIVEPALRDVTRELHRVRDVLLADGACTVYSPCLHEHACPALVRETDWCHEERPWTPPPLIAAIDREVGFIKDALKFSYLLLRKDGRTIAARAPTVYRVVSELRVMKGEKRAWLCNETGRPEVGRLDRERSEANAAFDAWHRGAIIRIDQIVRKDRKGRASTIGRIPVDAAVEILWSV